MLVLSRKPGEKVVIGGGITVTVVSVLGNQVRLAIDAPDQVRILRAELLAGRTARCQTPTWRGSRRNGKTEPPIWPSPANSGSPLHRQSPAWNNAPKSRGKGLGVPSSRRGMGRSRHPACVLRRLASYPRWRRPTRPGGCPGSGVDAARWRAGQVSRSRGPSDAQGGRPEAGRCIPLLRLLARSLGRLFPCVGPAFRGASNGVDPPPAL